MKRRDFLRNTTLSLPFAVGGLKMSAIAKSKLFSLIDGNSDRILVLIQLNGGNDGLNTLIPLNQYGQLATARPELIIPENQLIELDNSLAIHPSMDEIANMYSNDKITIVQSVGYPDQNRSHFRSTDIWTSGSASNVIDSTGWLGRYFYNRHAEYPTGYPNEECMDPFALSVGNTVSETCQGPSSNFSLAIQDPENLNPLFEGEEGEIPDTPYGLELDFVRNAIKQTNAYSERITEVADAGMNAVDYPDNALAGKLQNVAKLISGGLQTKVYIVNLGGFDTHAAQINQGDSTAGIHALLLQYISTAVNAFQADLEAQSLDDKVVGMTFSEFGRQIAENLSLGTDHGTAAPLFLFGSCVTPGIIGENPEIPDEVMVQEGVAMQHDFRDVYGSLLVDWFGAEEDEVKSLLHEDFIKLNLISCSFVATNNPEIDENFDITVFPNPVRDNLRIAFTLRETMDTRISIFNAEGKEVDVVTDQSLSAGEHTLSWEARGIPSGNYYVHVRGKFVHKAKLFIKY